MQQKVVEMRTRGGRVAKEAKSREAMSTKCWGGSPCWGEISYGGDCQVCGGGGWYIWEGVMGGMGWECEGGCIELNSEFRDMVLCGLVQLSSCEAGKWWKRVVLRLWMKLAWCETLQPSQKSRLGGNSGVFRTIQQTRQYFIMNWNWILKFFNLIV